LSRDGEKMKTKYSKDFPLAAEGLARNGLTDKEIARKLGISVSTYYQYQLDHPEFLEALKKGKSPVDIEVENALLKRALGYEYEEISTEYDLKQRKGEKDQKASPTAVRKVKKAIVPDVTAQIFWLKNRRPDKWRDKHDIEHSGGITVVNVISAIPRSGKIEMKREKANRMDQR
jgi:transcriptional regulator with XRE-family HTH domain